MTKEPTAYPVCFGILESVFPKGEDGLRSTPVKCHSCPHKVLCLKKAAEGTSGMTMKEEVIDRAYGAGLITFYERWSRKKYLKKKIEK